MKEIISKVGEVLNVEIQKEKGETRKGEYAAIYADNNAKKLLGWNLKEHLKTSF